MKTISVKRPLGFVLGSVLGGAAVQLALVSCGAGGSSPVDSKPAHAQEPTEPAPRCVKWEVQGFLPSSFRVEQVTFPDVNGVPQDYQFSVPDTFELPDGWEPFAGDGFGSVTARRCAAHE